MAKQNGNVDQSRAIEQTMSTVEMALATCSAEKLELLPDLQKAVVLSRGVTAMRKVLTDEFVEEVFMPLQGTPLGFQTDRDNNDGSPGKPTHYEVDDVRECMIEAMVHGFRPTGNEVNILAGRTYGAKAGYERKVREWEGLTDLRLTPGVPHNVGEKGSLVAYTATWNLNGEPMSLTRDTIKGTDGINRDSRIPVKVNKFMGADAIVGKATRKMLKAIHDLLSGSAMTLTDGEVDSLDTTGETVSPAPAPAEQDGQRMKMGDPPAAKSETAETPAPAEAKSAPAAAAPVKDDPDFSDQR